MCDTSSASSRSAESNPFEIKFERRCFLTVSSGNTPTYRGWKAQRSPAIATEDRLFS